MIPKAPALPGLRDALNNHDLRRIKECVADVIEELYSTRGQPREALAAGAVGALRDHRKHVLVIGHAGGLELAFSFQDNLLLERDDTLLHYRSPTDPGSSGSPLFDAQWRLIGLHHAGKEDLPMIADPTQTMEANEGFSWIAIGPRSRLALATRGSVGCGAANRNRSST